MDRARQASQPTTSALTGSRADGGGGDYAANLYILDKEDNRVRYAPNRAQAHFLANRTGRDIILKSRQLGFSTCVQADYFVAALTETTRIATLAHDDETTQKLRRMAQRFYDNLPPEISPKRGLANATTTTYPATGSEVTIVTAGNTAAGRGGTYGRVHGSEVAFWKDAESNMAGILQGVSASGQIVLESTPNGAQGWFYERCMDALKGIGVWTLWFYAWWWDDGYVIPLNDGETLVYSDDEAQLVAKHNLTPEQIKWRRNKQSELGRLFPQEYPENPRTCFLASGTGYFSDIKDIERVFTAPLNAAPIIGHRYIAGLDFGQKSDFTAMSVIDATTLEEVELWRDNKKPWGDMRAHVRETCAKWGIQTIYPEANSMGTTNIEELHKEFATHHVKTVIAPFDTTPQSKPPLVTEFHNGIDQGGLKLLNDEDGVAEISAYQAKQSKSGAWTYEGQPNDDTVIARMLAWHGIVSGRTTIGRSASRYA